MLFGKCITRGPQQVLYVAHTGDPDGMEDAAIYKVDLNGNLVGKFGSAGKLPKEFGLISMPAYRRTSSGRPSKTAVRVVD